MAHLSELSIDNQNNEYYQNEWWMFILRTLTHEKNNCDMYGKEKINTALNIFWNS